MMEAIDRERPEANRPLYQQALDARPALCACCNARQAGEGFRLIVARNLAAPLVYVHRDFMPRNLMVGADGGPLGVLDFQDAVHGPITYDIASLMRDAFLSWDEDFVLDITIRYWERARKLGLMDFEDWHSDFGSFWRAVEWMGLQRHLKVAGIFARLTLRDGKPKYLQDAPRFIAYIRHTAGRYRELTPLLRLVDRIEGTEAPAAGPSGGFDRPSRFRIKQGSGQHPPSASSY
jgi:aminoglycoside/choline kinase family phosphotransferase